MSAAAKPSDCEPSALCSPAFDLPAVERWFARHVAGASPPLRSELIAGGHSNLTYRIADAGGRCFALRRPPLGDQPPGAHDVLREARILMALRSTAVPVPPVTGTCRDNAVIGAPFYVMEWVEGPILDRLSRLEALLPTEHDRRHAAFALVDTLAALHRIDVTAVGLADLGPHERYLERQLARMWRVWERTKTRELPLIDSLHERLQALCPAQQHTGLVHSDFRFGNMILRADGTPAAVLDWELCAIGDVLVDLGFLLANWDLPGDPWPNVWMEVPPTRGGGFPTREELIERYARVSGRDPAHIGYYQAFCLWRIAIIAEGMKRRYADGAMAEQAVDPELLERRVRDRAERADRVLQESTIPICKPRH
jgi:aminoglycoside phosphotransferase (APT) family kinase protein